MFSATSGFPCRNRRELSAMSSDHRAADHPARTRQSFPGMRFCSCCRLPHHNQYCSRTFRSELLPNCARRHTRRIIELGFGRPTCFAVRKRLSAASIAGLLGSRKLSELLTTEALVTEVSEKESRHRATSNATGRHGLLNGNRNNNQQTAKLARARLFLYQQPRLCRQAAGKTA
jgi:hypothetical protein